MEPRIATLLGSTTVERAVVDPLLSLPPLAAPRRPRPLEPVSDDAAASLAPIALGTTDTPSPAKRQKTSVPIARVLNKETPLSQAVPAAATSLPPFSGRLSDLLLDPSQQHAAKRRRQDEQAALPATSGSESNPLTLPKPPQLPKKATKRPRIPPLLQGLHQPPPLPEGRLFPPITGEGGDFGRNIGERPGLRRSIRPAKGDDNGDVLVPTAALDSLDETRETTNAEPVRSTSRSASDKENRHSTESSMESVKSPKAKETKKRNKWSDQETKDLLVGVSRFGIGNWKKILHCSDFTFNHRTAVDLKDRFRTCCPGEGLKIKKPKRKKESEFPNTQESCSESTSQASTKDNDTAAQHASTQEASASEKMPKKPRAETHRKGPAELAEMGIHGPFMKNKRRERREFTEADDENLLKGFERYGSSWHKIRDDVEFGFLSRHPTDLRDRFRIRHPEIFAKAGLKLKPKHEMILKEKEKDDVAAPDSFTPERNSFSQDASEMPTPGDVFPGKSTTSVQSSAGLGSLPPREPLRLSFHSPLEDFADVSEGDGDATRSPVVLNRNIFEWANANPSALASTTTASLPAVTGYTGESFLNGMDGMHINPMATLNLPMALLTSNLLSAMPSHLAPSSMPSRNLVQYSNNNPMPAPVGTAHSTNNTASKPATDPLLRTPNLPTIVFPQVPASSARSAVHNLPPPTDLLSGIDADARPDPHNTGLVLDDTMNFTLAAAGHDTSSTLAPMMAGALGRGMMGLDRSIMDEVAGERRV